MRRAVGLPALQTARNNVQRSLTCGHDPALPVWPAQIELSGNRSSDFLGTYR